MQSTKMQNYTFRKLAKINLDSMVKICKNNGDGWDITIQII